MQKPFAVTAVLLVLPVVCASATLPVIDVSAIGQMVTQYATQVKQYAQQIQQTQNQIAQITNQIRQIEYAYTTVQHGITNLKTFNLNYAGALLNLGNQLQQKLWQAEAIGYQAQQAVRQAQSIYPRIAGVLDGSSLRQFQHQWSSAQRDAARIAIEVQAILGTQQQQMQRITEVANRAAQAEGNLQAQQALAQGQSVIATQLVSIEQQLATQGRLQAMEMMRQAAETEATQAALEQASGTIDLGGVPSGKILSLSK